MTNLTPTHEVNAREIDMMVGKATCAYANMMMVIERANEFDSVMEAVSAKRVYEAEYEATTRILDFFVEESLYEIQHAIIAEAEAMMAA